MMSVEAAQSALPKPVGIVGVKRPDSPQDAPVYDVPYGSVHLSGQTTSSSMAGFNIADNMTAPLDFDGQDDDDEEEADDDDDQDSDSSRPKSKDKKAKNPSKKQNKPKQDFKGSKDVKTGRRKIKIEFIEDDARRHITFSKRKAGIMKKAYELATLTGTQVLLLVVSQTGLVYTFTTPKLQALVTEAEGRNLIQACLNAPDPPAQEGQEKGQDEDGTDADDGSSPSGSSGIASNKGRGKLFGNVRTNRKRTRNESNPKPSNLSVPATDGDDSSSRRGRGRPRKDTVGSVAESLDDVDETGIYKRPRTASKSIGSAGGDSHSHSSLASLVGSNPSNTSSQMMSQQDSMHSASRYSDIMSQSFSADHAHQSQLHHQGYGHSNAPNYAYNPATYFASVAHPSNDTLGSYGHQHPHLPPPHGTQGTLATSGDASSSSPWSGAMSPSHQHASMFGVPPAQDRNMNPGSSQPDVYGNYGLQQASYGHYAQQPQVPVHPQEIHSQRQGW